MAADLVSSLTHLILYLPTLAFNDTLLNSYSASSPLEIGPEPPYFFVLWTTPLI